MNAEAIRTVPYLCAEDVRAEHVARVARAPASGDAARFERTVLDTFDRRLASEGLILTFDERTAGCELTLRRADGTQLGSALETAAPTLATDITDRRLRRLLAPLVGQRALLPRARWDVESTRIHVLNDDARSIGALDLDRQHAAGTGLGVVTTLSAVPKRGYQGEFRRRIRGISTELPVTRSSEDGNLVILGRCTANEAAYTNKPRIPLTPDMPAAIALADMVSAYSAVMACNEKGVAAATDIEFLHDFRICVRRQRSLLGLFDDLLPRQKTLRRELKWLNQVTGPLRDLDVWLSEFVPPRPGAPGIAPNDAALHDWLRAQQAVEQRTVQRALATKRYRRLRDALQAIEAPLADGDDTVQVGTVAEAVISRQYRALRRKVRGRGSRMRTAALHDLRKDVKRLRYFIDACADLYDATQVRTVSRHLKQLQDAAGQVCDVDARGHLLRGWLDAAPRRAPLDALRAVAAESVVPSTLRLSKRRYRPLVMTFERFGRKNVARDVERLLRSAQK